MEEGTSQRGSSQEKRRPGVANPAAMATRARQQGKRTRWTSRPNYAPQAEHESQAPWRSLRTCCRCRRPWGASSPSYRLLRGAMVPSLSAAWRKACPLRPRHAWSCSSCLSCPNFSPLALPTMPPSLSCSSSSCPTMMPIEGSWRAERGPWRTRGPVQKQPGQSSRAARSLWSRA